MVQQTREAGRVMSAASISVSKVLDGMDSHLYIRFSAYPDGRLMTTEPNKDTKYIGVVSTKENRPPTDPARYLWADFKGEDGQETFVWMRYSEQNNGLPKMETSPTAKTQYMGVYSGPSNNPPVNPSDYKWVKTKGEQGEASYLHIRYSDYADGRDFYEKPRKTTMYIGIAVTVSKATPPNKEAYDWAEFGVNIEFGGRNYILESKEPKEIKKSGTVQWETLYGASKFAQDWLGYYGFAVITFNAQTFGTMKNKPVKFRIVGLNGTDRIYTENFEIPVEDIQKERFTYSYVLEVTERAKNATSFIIEVERWNHDFAMEIATAKLERGNRPTDWSAAPEDVNSEMMEIKKGTASLEVLIEKLESGKANTAELKALANELSGYVKSNTSYGGVKISDEGVLLDSTNMEVVLDGRRGFIVRRKNPTLTIMEVKSSGEFNIQASNLNIQVEEAQKEVESINKTKVQFVNMEYYLSNSTTSLIGGSWKDVAPTWVDGKYMWSRTKTVYGDGTVKYTPSENGTCIAGAKGKDGSDGIPGKDGVGLKDTVIHYAISTSGAQTPATGWTSSVPTLEKGKYLWTRTVWHYTDNSKETGYSVTYISKDGNSGSDGLPGKDGVGIEKTTIEYAASKSGVVKPTSGWSTTIPTVPEGDFLWTRTTWLYTDKTSEQGFSVAKMGEKGGQGIQGPPGKDGQPTYTWIKYADSPTSGISDSPTNKKYIGIAYNKTTPNKSNSYSDYQWSLIKGSDGIPGKNGADGKPKYTWIVYADDIKGGGISNSSEGKGYMGIAYNKDVPTPTLTPSLYQWVELVGAIEFGGRNYIKNSKGDFVLVPKNTGQAGDNFNYKQFDVPISSKNQYMFTCEVEKTHGTFNEVTVLVRGPKSDFNLNYTADISNGKIVVNIPANDKNVDRDNILVYAGIAGQTRGNGMKIRKAKLEIGNKPTDWSPAPEDVETEIKDISASLDVQAGQIEMKADQIVVDNLKNTVNKQGTAITQNSEAIKLKAEKSQVDGLTGKVDKQQTQITQNAEQIKLKANQSFVNDINNKVTNQQAQINLNSENIKLKAEKSEVTNLKNELDGLEFGGTNLSFDTNYSQKPEAWFGSSATIVKGHPNNYVKVERVEGVGVVGVIQDGNHHFKHDEIYTVSFEIRTDNLKSLGYCFVISPQGNVRLDEMVEKIEVIKDNEWHKYTYTFKSWFNREKGRILIGGSESKSFDLRRLKLEKGNKPTDWSPAPEDVDAQVKEVETKFNAQLDIQSKEISAVVSKSNTNASEIGQLKVRSDKIETEVGKKVEISKVNEAILANERIIDTRTRNDNPNYYYTNYKSRKVREFKNTSTVGLPNDGTYAVVETDVKWSDTSGGQISQTAQTDKATYQRFSTSTTAWGPWIKTADMNDIDSVKTQITQLADNINARIVERDKIIAQINLSKEGVLIQGKNIHLDGNTKINNGIIKNAHIQALDAGKVNFGTLSGIMISGANSQWNLKDGQFKMTTPGNASQYIQIQNGSFKSFNGSTKTIEIQSDELAATSGGNSIRLNPQRLLFTGEGYKRTIDLTSQGLTVSSLVQDTGTGHFLNAGLEIESKGTQAYIDFRTSGRKNDYDSRIKSVGGSSADGQGTLELEAKNIDSMAQTFRFRNAQTINFNGALADNLPKNLIATAIAADNSVLSIEKAGSHTNHYFNFRMRGLNHGVKDWGVSTWASDEKLKANIEDTHMSGLGIVNEFRVREFNWKAGGHEPIGLIAQEVEKVLPNAVFQNLGDIRQLKPEAFIPVLIKAVQELSEKTQVLNQQIVELQLQGIREQIQQTTEKGEIQQ